jgi:ABC-2 type transport system ATP-binding protein
VIAVTGITKRYGDTLAVDDLSFEVRPGQITGFLGPNGSGKSTTMRIIMGLDNPDAGHAKVRILLKGLGKEGRTVFVSSHLMSEEGPSSAPVARE